MTPLQKALEKLNDKKIYLHEEYIVFLDIVEKILQEMEVDMINECDEKENKTKSTWKESSSQSDYPSQKL